MATSIRIAALLLVGLVLGCQPAGTPVPQNVIPIPELIRQDLETIVQTNQVGSEMVTIDENITKLAETEPEKAEALRKEYDKLKSPGGSPAAKAKKMMSKL